MPQRASKEMGRRNGIPAGRKSPAWIRMLRMNALDVPLTPTWFFFNLDAGMEPLIHTIDPATKYWD